MGETGSTLTHLEGALSGETYPADELANLDPADGRPLLARYDLEKAARTLTPDSLGARRTGGMWRWAEILPVRGWERVVSLGEGGTPLLAQPRLGRAFGAPHLYTKAEGLNPTGSFKARGMSAAVLATRNSAPPPSWRPRPETRPGRSRPMARPRVPR